MLQKVKVCSIHTKDISEILKYQFDHLVFKAHHILELPKETYNLSESEDIIFQLFLLFYKIGFQSWDHQVAKDVIM